MQHRVAVMIPPGDAISQKNDGQILATQMLLVIPGIIDPTSSSFSIPPRWQRRTQHRGDRREQGTAQAGGELAKLQVIQVTIEWIKRG